MSHTYKVPKHWSDLIWLETRHELLDTFSEKQITITIDFTECSWIDLHPLVDLQLNIITYCLEGGSIKLSFVGNSGVYDR